MYYFPNLEPVCCSMSSSNFCFLTCVQISQEAGQVVWYSTQRLYYSPLLLWKVITNWCLTQLKLIILQFQRPEVQPESSWAKSQGVNRAELLLEVPGRMFPWVFQLLEDTCLPLLIAPSVFRASRGGSRAFHNTSLWFTSCSHISFWLSCETFCLSGFWDWAQSDNPECLKW